MTAGWTAAALHDNKVTNECTDCTNSNWLFLCECPSDSLTTMLGRSQQPEPLAVGMWVIPASVGGTMTLHTWSHSTGWHRFPLILYKNNIKTRNCIYGQKNRTFHTQSVAKPRAHQSMKMWHRFSAISHLLPLVSITYLWKVGHSISNCRCW